MNDLDIKLTDRLKEKLKKYDELVSKGMPYVWMLQLNETDFRCLESALNEFLRSHKEKELLKEQYARITIVYMAEWYKRCYTGNQIGLKFETKDIENLLINSGLDIATFVYRAPKGSRRFLHSLYVLGGLPVKAEVSRDEDNKLLKLLCRLYHGDDIAQKEIEKACDSSAFKKSIEREHSLFHYLNAIIGVAKNYTADSDEVMPFAEEDLKQENSIFNQLIDKIKKADKDARQDKFELEWLVTYDLASKKLTRRLHIRMRPELTGGRFKEYIDYDRMSESWDIENPEQYLRIAIDVELVSDGKVIRSADFSNPIITFSNGGSTMRAFVANKQLDDVILSQIPPLSHLTVSLKMCLLTRKNIEEQTDGKEIVVLGPLDEYLTYMQLYKIKDSHYDWTSHPNRSGSSAVLFTGNYTIDSGNNQFRIESTNFRQGENLSEALSWCPFNDNMTLRGNDGMTHKFFNRQGYYQLTVKNYPESIRYKENSLVEYRHVDLNPGENINEIPDDAWIPCKLPLLFGCDGVIIREFESRKSENFTVKKLSELIEPLQYKKKDEGYQDITCAPPEMGEITLRAEVEDELTLKKKVFYVPFDSKTEKEPPIRRNLETQEIELSKSLAAACLDRRDGDKDTLQFVFGKCENEQVVVDVFRPFNCRELWLNNKKIKTYENEDDDIEIPLINCEDFTVKDFTSDGVKTYSCVGLKRAISEIEDFGKQASANDNRFVWKKTAKEFDNSFPDNVYIYLCKERDDEADVEWYEWDYQNSPSKLINCNNSTIREGIVFQSRKDAKETIPYFKPKNKIDIVSRFSGGAARASFNFYKCFKTITAHQVYYILFKPMLTMVYKKEVVRGLIIPLLSEKKGEVTDDIKNLKRFGEEFHINLADMLHDSAIVIPALESINDPQEREEMKGWIENLARILQ